MIKIFATLDDGRRIAINVPEQHLDRVLAAWQRNALDPAPPPPELRNLTLWDCARALWITANAKRVADEIREERYTTCQKCEHIRKDESGQAFCRLCKCTLSPIEKLLPNLAAIEENLPEWGCHHPQRYGPAGYTGKGWAR